MFSRVQTLNRTIPLWLAFLLLSSDYYDRSCNQIFSPRDELGCVGLVVLHSTCFTALNFLGSSVGWNHNVTLLKHITIGFPRKLVE
jgi:hypothetical protein